MENKNLSQQLVDYYLKASAAESVFAAKSDKVDNFGYQGTENLSPEGVGGSVAMGALAAKAVYAGARFIESIVNVPQSYSNTLDAVAIPFNAAAGVIFIAGAGLFAGSLIKDAISSRFNNNSYVVSQQGDYALDAYKAIQNGSLKLEKNATVEEAMAAVREQQVEKFLMSGGDKSDVEMFYPQVDAEGADKLIAKAEKSNPEQFEQFKIEAQNNFNKMQQPLENVGVEDVVQ